MTDFEIGQRIKQTAKEKGYTNQRVADIVGYAWDKTISAFYSGKKKFSNNQIETLAIAWSVRPEYLKGIDDFKTDADTIAKANQEKAKKVARDLTDYKIMRTYLRTLGLTLHPTLCFVGNRYQFYQSYYFLKNSISDEGKKIISTMAHAEKWPLLLPDCDLCSYEQDNIPKNFRYMDTFTSVPKDRYGGPLDEPKMTFKELATLCVSENIDDELYDSDFFDPCECLDEQLNYKNKYDEESPEEFAIPLRSDPREPKSNFTEFYSDNRIDEAPSIKDVREMTKEDVIPNQVDDIETVKSEYMNELRYGALEIRYTAEYKGKSIAILDINHVSAFFHQVDALAKVSIETFLLQD